MYALVVATGVKVVCAVPANSTSKVLVNFGRYGYQIETHASNELCKCARLLRCAANGVRIHLGYSGHLRLGQAAGVLWVRPLLRISTFFIVLQRVLQPLVF